MKFLPLTLDFLTRITLTLVSSFAITCCFQKVNFQGFYLVILNVELPSALLYASCQLFKKQAALWGNNSVLVKIRDSLLSIKNLCINVTSKLILSSVSRFKFVLLKSRVKLILSKSNVSHYHYVNRTILCNLLAISLPFKEELNSSKLLINIICIQLEVWTNFKWKTHVLNLFVINALRQGNNVKIKLNLKINLQILQF